MRIFIDAWAPEFGTAMAAGELREVGPSDLTCEVPTASWSPRRPADAVRAAREVTFVDGVRRIDARLWSTDDESGETQAGLAVSLAAGTVRCDGRATLQEMRVARHLIGSAGLSSLDAAGAAYQPRAVPAGTDEALLGEVQRELAELERAVARAAPPSELLVVDGPLSGREMIPGAIGLVKTHHQHYLPPTVREVVAALAPGERTPVFLTQPTYPRYSWYLRLPHGRGHPWAGVVRIEAAASVELDDVIRRADVTAATLPAFASHPHRDPRAPANLYPIGGLEAALKRRLGDPAYLERQLRRAAGALA